jgi:two-component system response regulator (stage 0 sporulation protein F)
LRLYRYEKSECEKSDRKIGRKEDKRIMEEKVIPPAALRPRGNTILIVEDDIDIGFFLQQLIEEETPYQTAVLTNGIQALEQVPLIQPCLLMLDYRLPGLNGIELFDRLQQNKDTAGIPAIMMSATLPMEELQQRGIIPLRKPMDIGGVIRLITHALATSEEKQLQEKQSQ